MSRDPTSRRPELTALRSVHPAFGALAIAGACLALLAAVTPPTPYNGGLGYDGTYYGQMAQSLRDGTRPLIEAGFAFRVLPSALVALSPFDIVTGFLVLNVLSILGSAALVFVLLRRYGAEVRVAYLGVLWWMALPMGARWGLADPVLTDALAFFLLMVLVLATVDRRRSLFAVGLVAGVLTRENLFMAVPFLWRSEASLTGPVRATIRSASVALPAVATFLVLQRFPILPPAPVSGGWLEAHHLDTTLGMLLTNYQGEVWKAVLAAPLSLGLLFWIPIAIARRTGAFLLREPRWGWYLFMAIGLAFVGGTDHDRYFYVCAPALLVLVFGALKDLWLSWPRAIALTVLHLIVLRVWQPLGAAPSDLVQYGVEGWGIERLVAFTVVAAAAFATSWPLLRAPRTLATT